METRNYEGATADLPKLICEFQEMASELKIKVEVVQEPGGAWFVLPKHKWGKRLMSAMGSTEAIVVRVKVHPSKIEAQVGGQKQVGRRIWLAIALLAPGGYSLGTAAALDESWDRKITQAAWRAIEKHIEQAARTPMGMPDPRS